MKQRNDILVSGVALFAMFFGAGNLIFPSYLGFMTGDAWLIAAIGFLLIGVGLPLMGIAAFSEARSIEHFADKVSPKFNMIYLTLLAVVIGPLFAVPRTASTTFELAILPILVQTNLLATIITSVIFFTITFYFSMKEHSIVDIIGKYLTPVILVCLVIIGYVGLTTDIGIATTSTEKNNFYFGFTQGYQTMDALAAVLFGMIILKNMVAKGYKEPKEQRKLLLGSGIIAATGLSTVYFLLIFLGSKVSANTEIGHSTTSVITYIVERILGQNGKIFFGLAVGAACLTTAIGIVAFVSELFTKITKFSYKFWVTVICIFSCVMSVGGVDFLVSLSVPVLLLLYPVTVALILLNLIKPKSDLYFKVSVITTIIFSIIDVLGSYFNLSFAQQIILWTPLGAQGFVWIVPFVLSLVAVSIHKRYCIKSQ
ncbi:MAG: branched-chain amino acid transport system II carrier protein [Brevinema sp.]